MITKKEKYVSKRKKWNNIIKNKIYFKNKNQTSQDIAFKIKKLQNSTEYLIPKTTFYRIVRQIGFNCMYINRRWTIDALECLHDASEHYLIDLFKDVNKVSQHDNRECIYPRDIHLSRRLRFYGRTHGSTYEC
mmetsp:Transcript_2088/g.2601  ORF Transcript_2088/g.2601 Transcript_2088/m.2601 type:complete len:133 (+) Transcript_2088:7-405(+)